MSRARANDRPSGHPRAKRRFSQNFLVDAAMAHRIVDLTRVGPEDTVVEIGPGTGALTQHLVERAKHVHAVELDRELFARLGVEYELESRITLHQEDILNLRLEDLVPEGPVVVVGNLPYNITSDLVLWMLEQPHRIARAVVLMQREVAVRLTASPGEREAGTLTLALWYRAEAERLVDVPPTSFRPRPRVTSSLVAFRFLDRPRVQPKDERVFFRVIRAAFRERRKTLANALAGGLALPREHAESAIRAAGLDPRVRGERLDLEAFCRLADVLKERGVSGGKTSVPGPPPDKSKKEEA